ncbi:polysaccharide deacetylase family protein [Radicibacter daui]|uniref:polysaccharide deacetylase family protein n=1 Tax=Radicibacter daui TaxID=3064829 RepID=UPI0040468ADD
MRDFLGYANKLPDIRWPEGKRIAVSFVLNFEEGSEFAIGDGDDRNEAVYEVIDRIPTADPCIESHFEYGTRVGYWRIAELFDAFHGHMTVSACGRAVERSPWLVQDAHRRGHEISAHGYRWESHANLTVEEEKRRIERTRKAIEDAVGEPPVGWHTRSASSPNTRRLLVDAGFLYDSDAYNDDTPYFVEVGEKRHLVLPYAFDTNDMQFQNTQRLATGHDFADYVCDAFDWLWREGESMPRMMSIGLHLRMIGRPGRIGALEAILQHMAGKGGAWITTRSAIAHHWLAASQG